MKIIEVSWVYCEGERYSESKVIGLAQNEEKAEELISEFKESLSPSEVDDYTYRKKEVEVR